MSRRLSDRSVIPIIRIYGRLLVPLQGEVSDAQAAELSNRILKEIQTTGARGVIVDVSGLWLIDSHLCSILGRIAQSAKLMGAHLVLVGVNADVAMTLQSMGVRLEGVHTALGLDEAMDELDVLMKEQDVGFELALEDMMDGGWEEWLAQPSTSPGERQGPPIPGGGPLRNRAVGDPDDKDKT